MPQVRMSQVRTRTTSGPKRSHKAAASWGRSHPSQPNRKVWPRTCGLASPRPNQLRRAGGACTLTSKAATAAASDASACRAPTARSWSGPRMNQGRRVGTASQMSAALMSSRALPHCTFRGPSPTRAQSPRRRYGSSTMRVAVSGIDRLASPPRLSPVADFVLYARAYA